MCILLSFRILMRKRDRHLREEKKKKKKRKKKEARTEQESLLQNEQSVGRVIIYIIITIC